VAAVGFDWTNTADVVSKIEEEVAELRDAVAREGSARTEEEMGDLLFAIANLSRKLNIEPETALRKANDKFTRRFTSMEQMIEASGRTMPTMTLDQLEQEWQLAKSRLQPD
jgi:ATP diphosphatase